MAGDCAAALSGAWFLWVRDASLAEVLGLAGALVWAWLGVLAMRVRDQQIVVAWGDPPMGWLGWAWFLVPSMIAGPLLWLAVRHSARYGERPEIPWGW